MILHKNKINNNNQGVFLEQCEDNVNYFSVFGQNFENEF